MESSPLQFGPYQVLEALGRGGGAAVYRARHEVSGRVVAVKTVALASSELARILGREIQMLARLRHPGIVRLLDHGVQEAGPWYAMELVEGPDLLEACRRLWQPAGTSRRGEPEERPATATRLPERRRLASPDLESLLSLFRRLCAPLAYLHGEGLVHRDLKPANILLRSDGEPVLVDFGLAAGWPAVVRNRGRPQVSQRETSSREELALGLAGGGSPATMAPEQLENDLVDARADLYALGCLLYLALTGRLPYLTVREALDPALVAPPPSLWVDGLPEPLDRLLARLLSKDRRHRLGHATEVASALARLGARNGAAAGPRPRVYLYRPALAGRQRPWERLRQRLDSWEAGHGGLLLLEGESGAGKTRLLLEAIREVNERCLTVAVAECPAPQPSGEAGELALGTPLQGFQAWLQTVADRCREHGAAEADRLLGSGAAVLAPYEPALQRLPGVAAEPPPEALPEGAARLRLFGCLAQTLAAHAAVAPLLLVMDDLHWADELTLEALGFLVRTRRLEQAGVLVLGASRPEEAGTGLTRLRQANGVESLSLGRLDAPAVAEVIRDMLGMDEAPGRLLRLVLRHTEGNPLFVAEYLRLAVDEGLLRHEAGGDWTVAGTEARLSSWEGLDSRKLPASLQELISRRLAGLPQQAGLVAEQAAVFGRQAPVPWLVPASGLDPEAWAVAGAELQRREILEEMPDDSLRFTHDKLREVLYRRIPARRRRKLHEAAALWLEQHESRLHATALGRHWQAAGHSEMARPWYLQAAQDAARRHAQTEAAGLYHAYLALVVEPEPESVAARGELARLVFNGGRLSEARTLLDEALAEAEGLGEPGLAADVLCQMTSNHRIQGNLAEAERCGRLALRRAGQARDVRRQVLALLQQASASRERWQERRVARCLEKAARLARQSGVPQLMARALSAEAVALADLGRLEKARGLYEEAIAALRGLGERRGLAVALGNLAVNAIYEGRLEEALELSLEALAIQRQIGDRISEGLTLGNLGSLRQQRGELALAWRTYEEALAVQREVGDAWAEAVVLGDQAELCAELGQVPQALELFARAARAHRRSSNLWNEAEVLRAEAALRRRLGASLGSVERRLRRAERLALEAGHALERIRCQCERGHVALARGRDARRWLARAKAAASRLGGAGESSLIGRALARLEAAVREEAQGLFRGERAEDLPRGLREWLAASSAVPVRRGDASAAADLVLDREIV